MWHLEETSTVATECRLSQEMRARLSKAATIFEASEEEIVAQALREFFEKHGIHNTIEAA